MPRKPEAQKLPRRVAVIVELMRKGERLTKQHRTNRLGNAETTYTLEPSGIEVAPSIAQTAIMTGQLKAGGDGLFPGMDQSWVV